jgi:hypothetical protein
MMHIVREIKKYHHTQVADALYEIGFVWKYWKRRTHNIDKMLTGMAKCHLEIILSILERGR